MNDKYINVSDINKYIKSLLDGDSFLKKVYLKGEISNFKFHPTGHLYFSIKDDSSKINAVMFDFYRQNLGFIPEDGMNILVEGHISSYVPNGNYQLYVEKMELDGIGNLYIEFEKLKNKLKEEGLFSADHKQTLPLFPEKIGIITASSGAAIKDILSTIKRRFPLCETILFPSLVQGDGAKESIVKQIKKANTYDIDLLIVGRGGGSIEDLWAFNEEIVARAIYESKVPIISAVGHDVDYTISDFVADLRAPTPTGAAEMAVPNLKDISAMLKQYEIRLTKSINNKISNYHSILSKIKDSYVLRNPLAIYEVKYQLISNYMESLNNSINNKIKVLENELRLNISKLQLLNPLNILEKGYSVISLNHKIIKDYKDLKINDEIVIKLFKGKVKAKVSEKIKEEKNGKK